MKYMVYFTHYEVLYTFLTFNRKKLQPLRDILIYILDRNSYLKYHLQKKYETNDYQIKGKDWISRGLKFFSHLIINTKNEIGESICIRKVYRAG